MVNQQISKLLSDCETYGCTSSKLKHGRVIMRDPFSIPDTLSPRCGSPHSRNRIVKLDTICKTLSGVEVPVLTITDFKHPLHNNSASGGSPTGQQKIKKKKGAKQNIQESRAQEYSDPEHTLPVIFIAGRIHPSESHASWIIHGFLETVLSDLKLAQEMRKRFVMKVVPMCNVDGVIAGNNRTSLIGKDLNRRYEHPNQKMHPVNYFIKKEVARLQEEKRVMAFFDVHSHSRRKCTFLYGPRFPLHSPYYLGIRAVPKLLAEESEAFRYYSCKFKNERKKQGSARISMWRDLGVNLSYTMETSFLGFLNKERTTLQFTIPQLLKLGRDLARTLLQYALIKQRTMRSRPSQKRKESPQIKSHKIASSSELTRVHYKSPPSQGQSSSSPMSSTIKSEVHSSAGRLTLNNLTAENQKEGQLSEWMSFLQSGGDPRMFLEDGEQQLKERRKVIRVPSMSFGVDQLSDSLSDLDQLEDELREEEEEAKGARRGKHRTMQEVLEDVINDKEKIMRYKARKDKQEEEEGFDSEEFDEEELASSSDENQDNEKGSSESDSEDDFEEMLKQAIEESQAQHDPSEVGERRVTATNEQRSLLNNSVEGVLQARHFYPPTLPSQIYLNAQIAQECEHSSKEQSMRNTGRWGVKSRPKVSQEYVEEQPHHPRMKGGKRPKPAKPQIHVRNLFQECFDDRHVIETKNRWPIAKGLKPKLFKQAGVNKAYNRHILSRSGVKESSSVSLTRPTTQNTRFAQASELLPADISLPRNNNEYIAHSKAVQRVGNILQSTELPSTLSSYFSDMLGQQSKMRKESGAYALFRNEAAALNQYKQGVVPRDKGMEIVYFQQDSGGPTGRVYRAGLSYRPGTGRSVIVNRSSTMSCSVRGEYAEHSRMRKESGRVSEGTNFESPQKQHFIRAQSKGELGGRVATGHSMRGQERKMMPFSLAGIHSSPNTIYNSVLRGQGSTASIKMDESQNYSGLPTPPTGAPPILRPTQYGIGFIPSQSSTSFRGRITPSMLNKIQPDRDMTPQPPAKKLNVQNVGGTSNRGQVQSRSQGGGKKVLRIMEDSQRRKKSFQGMQQRVLVPSVVMAERITNSVLKKREPEKREKEGWMPRKSQTRGYD